MRAPLCAKAIAVARPMPVGAPVIKTTGVFKAMLKQGIAVIPAPVELRERILAALDQEDRADSRARVLKFRKPAIWLAAMSMAAALALLVVNVWSHRPDDPSFEAAIAAYEQSERSFAPTVGAGSNEALAISLINQFGVPMVWDFSSLGLSTVGGRFERGPDGKVMAYTMYKGGRGSVLCVIKREDTFHPLSGGRVVRGIHLYQYKGYALAATNKYAVFCVMVTRLPLDDLAHAFASANVESVRSPS